MKELPLGIQTFRQLREGNYLYVDKTAEIDKLISNGGKYYFLSRPRRFGKSLLVSTLEEIFSGNKQLFKDLWIYDKIDWKAYPVIHLDFSNIGYDNGEILKTALAHKFDKLAARHNISLPRHLDYKTKFSDLVEALSEKGPVVILIDEYDKPIIDLLHDPEAASENRTILRYFYSAIKGLDKYIKFAFITGVSKFSRVSVFSGLNNLNDITMDSEHATLLGYTDTEVTGNFKEYIDVLTVETPEPELLKDIKDWYNGYSWDGEQYVYNPYSIMNFFRKRKFANYWFESGTPSFLVQSIRKYDIDVKQLEAYKAGEAIFESFDIERMNVAALLFQTGYLTLKGVQHIDSKHRLYTLSFPNIEVKESLLEHILGEYSSSFADEISVIVYELKEHLNGGHLDKFFESVKSLFARIPYDMFIRDREGYYQTVIYIILQLIGININSEIETNQGRIDAVIETGKNIFIMEFKLGTADEALEQIHSRKYYESYKTSSLPVILVGVGFDPDLRNIGDYKSETLTP